MKGLYTILDIFDGKLRQDSVVLSGKLHPLWVYFNLRKLKLILPFLQGENRENDNVRVNCHLQKNEATSQPVPLNRIEVMREAFQMIQHNVLHLSIHLSLRCCTVCFSSHLPPEKLSTPFYLFVGWFTHKKRKDSYLDENATALPNVDRSFVAQRTRKGKVSIVFRNSFRGLKTCAKRSHTGMYTMEP